MSAVEQILSTITHLALNGLVQRHVDASCAYAIATAASVMGNPVPQHESAALYQTMVKCKYELARYVNTLVKSEPTKWASFAEMQTLK